MRQMSEVGKHVARLRVVCHVIFSILYSSPPEIILFLIGELERTVVFVSKDRRHDTSRPNAASIQVGPTVRTVPPLTCPFGFSCSWVDRLTSLLILD